MPEEKQTLSDLPPALIQGLRSHDGATPMVPRSVDKAILDRAEAHFGSRRTSRRRWALPAAAAAAAVLVTVFVVQPFEPARQTHSIADDIDGSGSVDVLDAFLLARQRVDDPSITQARVDALLGRIVSLSNEEDHQT